jgi:MFS superfamily sulfate permease-like transporter
MTDQNLMTLFVAVTTVAVLIQTGIVAGLCFASLKISRQADRAAIEARRLIEPVHRMVDTLESASNHLADFSASSQDNLRQWERQIGDILDRFRRRVA